MDDIIGIFLSWQFLVVGLMIFCVMYLFNNMVGPALWNVKWRWLRAILKALEGGKLMFPPMFGFLIGSLEWCPRPEPMADSPVIVIAFVMMLAGVCSTWIVKGIKKALAARGIDIELDIPPLQQKKKL